MTGLLELFPQPGNRRPLRGLHLDHRIRERAGTDSTYFYTGFISSIDGRIAVGEGTGAPEGIRNERDWRLFQELIAQADVVLVSGRYLRDLAAGRAATILADPSDPDSSDLVDYRRARGLSDRPAVTVVTRRGAIDPATAAAFSSEVLVAHGSRVEPALLQSWSDHGLSPVRAGDDDGVDLDRLFEELHGRGHRIVFSAAGPSILNIAVHALDTLYLTVAGTLLGGVDYSTMFEAQAPDPPLQFDLRSAHLDQSNRDAGFQIFLELAAVRDGGHAASPERSSRTDAIQH